MIQRLPAPRRLTVRHALRHATRARLAAAALAVAALVGCAPTLRVQTPLARPLADAWGVAVYPVVFRFPVSGFHAYDRGVRVAERLSAQTTRLVYGPGEFRLDDVAGDDLRRGTNLLAALPFSKERRPEHLYALRLVVEQAVSSTGRAVTNRGRTKSSHEDDVEVTVRAQVLSADARDVVFELSGAAHVDLFNIDTDRDPFPDVTRLADALVDAVVTQAGWRATSRADLGLQVLPVPGPALAFALPGQQSVRQELARFDALEQDGRLLGYYRQRDAELPRARLKLYRTAPHGLVVVSAGGAAARAGLRPDDVLVSADGEALTGRHVLERHVAAGRQAVVEVLRGAERLTVTLPGK